MASRGEANTSLLMTSSGETMHIDKNFTTGLPLIGHRTTLNWKNSEGHSGIDFTT
jgi:hypothetical protein